MHEGWSCWVRKEKARSDDHEGADLLVGGKRETKILGIKR